MAFNITVLDKEGNPLDWNILDAEVCELWNMPQDSNYYCNLPEKSYASNWYAFLSHCIVLLRAYDNSNKSYWASDFFKALLEFGRWNNTLESIQRNKYEIQLLFYWVSKDYEFKIENT
ncbi:MAG: hypothetical protein HDS17_07410 [Bacteroides sp.]|nr:hypothetical protein [Bacteroides sp.]